MRPIVGIAFVLAVLAITASSATAQEIIIEFNNYLVNVVTGYQPDTAGGIVETNKTIEDVITNKRDHEHQCCINHGQARDRHVP